MVVRGEKKVLIALLNFLLIEILNFTEINVVSNQGSDVQKWNAAISILPISKPRTFKEVNVTRI